MVVNWFYGSHEIYMYVLYIGLLCIRYSVSCMIFNDECTGSRESVCLSAIWLSHIIGLHTKKAYTYSDTVFCYLPICLCIYAFWGYPAYWPRVYTKNVCIECLIAILRQNEYMHEQVAKKCAKRKFLNECTAFGYVSLSINHKLY